ncbi:GLPGLI family protein [Flavisolibacter nicotianae]|uniref:GLPGLI family protein n=1 Tax=Flavisolibacter nicotianae TaxID=2364882 RepID=UPI000EAE61B3|nr:GLPGLI family protein [Flavisolibacter nicotianae]
MKKSFLLLVILFAVAARAQQVFHNTVKIEFEKVVYVRQQYKELSPEWYETFKNQMPEQAVNYYEFLGDTTRSVFRETKEAPVNPRSWYQPIADKNVVYNDYKAGKTITQKPVFEETFLMEDSLLRIRWKLTADTRTIAGYDCRKALGFIDDTLAVFAFYTDEILVTGGPEGIHGLPGMILGVGVPRLHTTWFATKVEVNGVSTNNLSPATKGKKVDRKKMITALDDVLKNWGKFGRNMILNFVI